MKTIKDIEEAFDKQFINYRKFYQEDGDYPMVDFTQGGDLYKDFLRQAIREYEESVKVEEVKTSNELFKQGYDYAIVDRGKKIKQFWGEEK